MKRSIVIEMKDGTRKELELSKATMIKSPLKFLNLEQMKDGKWRLVWSESLIDDFSKVVSLHVQREG
jgi:hypothetical protein